ncbi:MAG: hypothetical protein NVS9B15_03270 [Acidobacteriaceae bacterium]
MGPFVVVPIRVEAQTCVVLEGNGSRNHVSVTLEHGHHGLLWDGGVDVYETLDARRVMKKPTGIGVGFSSVKPIEKLTVQRRAFVEVKAKSVQLS